MVEVMFIDKSGGCCDQSRVCRARWAGRRRAMSPGRSGRFPQTGARCRTFNYCLTLLIKQSLPSRTADRPPATPAASLTLRSILSALQGERIIWTLSGILLFAVWVMPTVQKFRGVRTRVSTMFKMPQLWAKRRGPIRQNSQPELH